MTLLLANTIRRTRRPLRLIATRRVGPHSFWSLLDRFETAQAALAALPELSRQGGAKQPLQPFAADLAEQEYRALRDLGGHLLVAVDGVFPPLLRQINDPPPVLSVRGNPDLLAQPSSPWSARATPQPTDSASPLRLHRASVPRASA